MFHRAVGQRVVHSSHSSSDKMIPASLPRESFVCRLGSVTPLRVDGQAVLEVPPSRMIP